MESLGGPINSFFFGQKMSSECLEQAAAAVAATSSAALDHMGYPQVSFLQMLNGVTKSEEEEEEDKKQVQFQIHQRFQRESNLQRLLEIQARYARPNPTAIAKIEPFRSPEERQLESCVTHASPEARSAVGPIKSAAAANVGTKERKKRKRSRAPQPPSAKKAQEVESQRMNHIAVERNRRRLMNSHLSTLRSLMPQSFVQRADQASIIAGAIDFVKELEQLLLSLHAKKRMRAGGDATATAAATTTSSCSVSSSCTNDVDEACHVSAPALLVSDFLIAPQYTSYSRSQRDRKAHDEVGVGVGVGVDVEATVVQGHVNLKIVGRRQRGQLVRGVAALEEIGLTVLHLNIASLDACSILYSLNLKVENECKLGSANEIATAVHQIFSDISSACCD